MLLLAGPSSRLARPVAFMEFKRIIPIAIQYLAYMAVLFLISTFMADGTSWVKRTWGAECVYNFNRFFLTSDDNQRVMSPFLS